MNLKLSVVINKFVLNQVSTYQIQNVQIGKVENFKETFFVIE